MLEKVGQDLLGVRFRLATRGQRRRGHTDGIARSNESDQEIRLTLARSEAIIPTRMLISTAR